MWPQRDGLIPCWIPLHVTRLFWIKITFRPLGMQHFYDSFALMSQICVRRKALALFGLREDELLPDLHITKDGVLRIGLSAHQEHQVNHKARAADRTRGIWSLVCWIMHLQRVSMSNCCQLLPVWNWSAWMGMDTAC